MTLQLGAGAHEEVRKWYGQRRDESTVQATLDTHLSAPHAAHEQAGDERQLHQPVVGLPALVGPAEGAAAHHLDGPDEVLLRQLEVAAPRRRREGLSELVPLLPNVGPQRGVRESLQLGVAPVQGQRGEVAGQGVHPRRQRRRRSPLHLVDQKHGQLGPPLQVTPTLRLHAIAQGAAFTSGDLQHMLRGDLDQRLIVVDVCSCAHAPQIGVVCTSQHLHIHFLGKDAQFRRPVPPT
mmetsp:Transcript_155043/g.497006  ORF Transcript_155043/g.497006 Transcript_155043/m.497006 type:complete len:236 (+) Transcript_155043:1407-2114(+)